MSKTIEQLQAKLAATKEARREYGRANSGLRREDVADRAAHFVALADGRLSVLAHDVALGGAPAPGSPAFVELLAPSAFQATPGAADALVRAVTTAGEAALTPDVDDRATFERRQAKYAKEIGELEVAIKRAELDQQAAMLDLERAALEETLPAA
jgi:hypothetical protein